MLNILHIHCLNLSLWVTVTEFQSFPSALVQAILLGHSISSRLGPHVYVMDFLEENHLQTSIKFMGPLKTGSCKMVVFCPMSTE